MTSPSSTSDQQAPDQLETLALGSLYTAGDGEQLLLGDPELVDQVYASHHHLGPGVRQGGAGHGAGPPGGGDTDLLVTLLSD